MWRGVWISYTPKVGDGRRAGLSDTERPVPLTPYPSSAHIRWTKSSRKTGTRRPPNHEPEASRPTAPRGSSPPAPVHCLRAAQGSKMTRDFVGYGAEPPHAQWPGDARIAVNFVINFEEGSELSYPAGDGVSETGLIESASTDAGNRRDLAAESMFEYGAR